MRTKKPVSNKYSHFATQRYAESKAPKFTGSKVAMKCHRILQALKKHAACIPFLHPVDPVKLNIPDYFTIIKEPMDISKVEERLANKKYKTTDQFRNDVRKVWDNSLRYNIKGTSIYSQT